MTEHNFEQMRRAMVASQLRTTGVDDARVVAAMGAVPRELFVPAGRAPLAYTDRIVPLDQGRSMPPPMALGRLLTAAHTRPEERALVIGSGTGYAAAVLAELVAHVVALEEAELSHRGPVPANVTTVIGSLAAGWAGDAPYDLILCDGAVEQVPAAIVDQLADGGRLATATVDRGVTRLAIGRKVGTAFGLVPFADVETPVLPGFAQPAGFCF